MAWGEPQFDKHAFADRRAKAVKATKTREGWDTTGISFSDFGAMHVHHTENVQERRLPTPEWVHNDNDLRLAVLQYCERALYITTRSRKAIGTDIERLQAIRDRAKVMLPNIESRLRIALAEYHLLHTTGTNHYKRTLYDGRRDPAIGVQNLDRQIQILRRGLPELVTAALTYYYRLGWSSVQIAEELHLTAPLVRMWLYRILHMMSGAPDQTKNRITARRRARRLKNFDAVIARCKYDERMAKRRKNFGDLNVRHAA